MRIGRKFDRTFPHRVKPDTKSQDSAQYQVKLDKIEEAFYRLTNPEQ